MGHVGRVLVLALMLALAGCGGRSRMGDDVVSISSTTATVSGPSRFGDLDPVEWQGGGPHGFPVHGIDVSKYQGVIDWNRVRQAGVEFAYIKATEGGDHADERFLLNWVGARQAGVRRGAYHYFYFCRPAAEQARWFIDHVPRDSLALPHVLDMEWNHRSRTCPFRPDGATVRREAKIYLDILERHYGRRPVIYTTVDFYRDTDIGRVGSTEFWLRSVAGHPRDVYPGQAWRFWQYTGTGVVDGIAGPVDINVFAGSGGQWALWAQ